MSQAETKCSMIMERATPPGMNGSSPSELGKYATIGIVHDLGNLLQVASCALTILSRSPGIESAPALNPVIDSAKTSLRRAALLVQQSLRSACERSDAAELADVSACLAEIEFLIRSTWPANIRIEFCDRSYVPAVKCSQLSLQNAIINLVFNARDAMPNGGAISIGVRAISQAGLPTQIEVRVSDNGLGMTQATIARAFEPFFTTKTDGLGGLGLPMVLRFADEVGGTVVIESEPGAGTTVTLRLPSSTSDKHGPIETFPMRPEIAATTQSLLGVSRVLVD